MGLLARFQEWRSSSQTRKAGTDIKLPTRQAGKVRSATSTSGDRGQDIANPKARFIEELSEVLRKRGDATSILRALASDDGLLSNAVYSIVQIANSGYKVIAYDHASSAASYDGTMAAQHVMARMDTLNDYTKGFNHKRTIQAIVESLLRETALTGGCAQELVLDSFTLPERLQVVAYNTLVKKANGLGGWYPVQRQPNTPEVELNIPTFFVGESNLEAEDPYAYSMFRAGLAQSFMMQEFMEDTRRAVRKSGHSRLTAKLIAEQVKASAPLSIQNDPAKLANYMTTVKEEVERALAGIEPDDAVVSYDSVEFDTHVDGSSKSDYAPLLKFIANLTGSSIKTPSSISGLRSEGSQSLSNAETLVYLKVAKSLQKPVEDIMSRALTLAVRLYGLPVYVKFKMNDIDLRPDSELESYKTAKQNRLLSLLSYGIQDDVSVRVDLGIPISEDMAYLQGTGFFDKTLKPDDPDRKDAMGKDLSPGTPTNAGGRDNE